MGNGDERAMPGSNMREIPSSVEELQRHLDVQVQPRVQDPPTLNTYPRVKYNKAKQREQASLGARPKVARGRGRGRARFSDELLPDRDSAAPMETDWEPTQPLVIAPSDRKLRSHRNVTSPPPHSSPSHTPQQDIPPPLPLHHDHPQQTLDGETIEVNNPHIVTNSSLQELNSDLSRLNLKKRQTPVKERWILKEDVPNLLALEFKNSNEQSSKHQ